MVLAERPIHSLWPLIVLRSGQALLIFQAPILGLPGEQETGSEEERDIGLRDTRLLGHHHPPHTHRLPALDQPLLGRKE